MADPFAEAVKQALLPEFSALARGLGTHEVVLRQLAECSGTPEAGIEGLDTCLTARVDQLDGRLTAQRQRNAAPIQNLEQDPNARIDQLDERLSTRIEQNVARRDQNIAQVLELGNTLGARSAEANARIAELRGNLSTRIDQLGEGLSVRVDQSNMRTGWLGERLNAPLQRQAAAIAELGFSQHSNRSKTALALISLMND